MRRPADARWKPASLLRREIERGQSEGLAGHGQRDERALSPFAAMREAAAAMSETMKHALAMVDQANAAALPSFEGRMARARRADDTLAEICALD